MYIRRKKNTLSIVYSLILATILSVGIIGSIFVYKIVDNINKQHLIDRANTVAQALYKPDLEKLKGSESDLASPSYEAIKNTLTNIRAVNSDVRFAYLVGITDKDVFFYADSEDPTSPDYSPPGETYPEASDLLKSVFLKNQVNIEGPLSDHWGTWISAFAPISLSNDGGITSKMVIGLDIVAHDHIVDGIAYAAIPLISSLLVLIILSSAYKTRKREQEYIAQKEEFLAIAAHEIRAPLTGIRWASEHLLANSKDFPSEDRNVISMIYTSCVNLISRINNLLSLTQIESQSAKTMTLEKVEIRPFIQEIIDNLTLSAKEKNITLTIDSSISNTLSLIVDREKMRQVFLNLISNGVKYTKDNTEVKVEYDLSDHAHVFEIINHSEKISEYDLQHIFDGYYRAKEAIKKSPYGTGIGLFLSKQLIALHKGTLSVWSNENSTTFIVELPR